MKRMTLRRKGDASLEKRRKADLMRTAIKMLKKVMILLVVIVTKMRTSS